MRTCTCCGQDKEDSEFPAKPRAGLKDKCKACHNEVQYRYNQKNPEVKKRIRRDRIQRNHERLREYKERRPCADCGRSYPSFVLDFHHLDDDFAKRSVSRLANTDCSWEKILEEIGKCVLICANCHRIRHGGLPNRRGR